MGRLEDDKYFNLGTYHRPVSTQSPEAQRWFDRGLVWLYGFNLLGASQCFEKAVAADPDCAMAYWGLAMSSGPHYNNGWRLFSPSSLRQVLAETYKTSQLALERLGNATAVEQAIVRALAKRFQQPTPTDDYSVWDRAYADAMTEVYRQFGEDDKDVVALCADALMNLTPWALWDLHTGKPAPGSRALEAQAAVEKALAQEGGREHPGLLHLHIHLMEMSPTPEAAVPSADFLRHLVPDSGHLCHMPSHIDVLVGDYSAAVAANVAAVTADTEYIKTAGAMNSYTMYRMHNYHSLIYAAMLGAQSRIALEYCTLMEQSLPGDLLASAPPSMADWIETFLGTRAHVLVRFGRWEDILGDLPLPADQALYCVTTATILYARGVAYAATGRTAEAEQEQERFLAALARVPPSRRDYPNLCVDILEVGKAMLAGEIEYRKGNFASAFAHLRVSVERDDHLVYSEPWGWMQPTRHALAALLLEQGRVAEAAREYAQDLGLEFDGAPADLPRGHQHPDNVWALHGFHECLLRLGRTDEAKLLEAPLKKALAVADVPIDSSCYCRRNCDGGAADASACRGSGKSCL